MSIQSSFFYPSLHLLMLTSKQDNFSLLDIRLQALPDLKVSTRWLLRGDLGYSCWSSSEPVLGSHHCNKGDHGTARNADSGMVVLTPNGRGRRKEGLVLPLLPVDKCWPQHLLTSKHTFNEYIFIPLFVYKLKQIHVAERYCRTEHS